MPELRAAGAAFLVAVLLCDLGFDLPVWRAPPHDPVAQGRALEAMIVYYRRITAKRSPLATSVALVMAGMLTGFGYELVSLTKDGLVRFVMETSLAVGPMALAGLRTFPCARRLASGEGDHHRRLELARAIARDHLVALPAMLVYFVIELARH